MDEILAKTEIEARYPSEWILVEVVESDKSTHDFRGRVLSHSPSRDVVYRKAVELRPTHSAILCTIEMPENTAIVL